MTISKPDRPGTIIRFHGSPGLRVEPGPADTVAIPIVADWGPVGADRPGTDGRQGGVQSALSFAEYTSLYGDSDTDGRTAVAGCFAGQGLPGAGGAGEVLIYRMAGSAAAPSTVSLLDRTGGSPVATLRLDGYYKGTRGNRISVIVDDDPVTSGNDRIRIAFDGVVREAYLRKSGDAASVVTALINSRSSLVRATALVTGSVVRLATTGGAAVPLTGGNDGTTLLSSDHLAALAAIAFKPFGVLAPYNLTDPSILASYVSWVQSQDDANRPCRLVVGGAAGESLATAQARTSTIDYEAVLNVGVGTYHDDLLGKDLSTAQLAPRIAGILAAKGQKHAITFAEIAGLHTIVGPSQDECQSAVLTGVVALSPTSSPDAELHVEKGVTTFTDALNASKPLDVYSDARLIGIMHNYVRNMKLWGDRIVIGALPVNDDTRALVRGQGKQLQDDLLRDGLIEPGDDVTIPKPFVICDDPKDPTKRGTIPYTFGWQFTATTDNILGEGAIL